jgi:hypothetical protein
MVEQPQFNRIYDSHDVMRHVLAHITQQDHQLTPQRSLIESNGKQRVQCSGYCGGSKASFVLPWWCFCVLFAGFVVV